MSNFIIRISLLIYNSSEYIKIFSIFGVYRATSVLKYPLYLVKQLFQYLIFGLTGDKLGYLTEKDHFDSPQHECSYSGF